jgi:hypothetical protein
MPAENYHPEDEEDKNCYSQMLETTLGWMPEKTAPIASVLMCYFECEERKIGYFSLAYKLPAKINDDGTFVDDQWICSHSENIKKPLYWTCCHPLPHRSRDNK